jgi:hypothetical protein
MVHLYSVHNDYLVCAFLFQKLLISKEVGEKVRNGWEIESKSFDKSYLHQKNN